MKKNEKLKLVEKRIKKAFHKNLAPGFQSLSSHIVRIILCIYSTHIIYFYDIEFICFIQIEYQNESYLKITLDYCINIYMILIIYLNYHANTV